MPTPSSCHRCSDEQRVLAVCRPSRNRLMLELPGTNLALPGPAACKSTLPSSLRAKPGHRKPSLTYYANQHAPHAA